MAASAAAPPSPMRTGDAGRINPPGQGSRDMKGFVEDIENLAIKNRSYRKVLYTASDTQLVLMTLKPLEEIGEEVHNLDQFFRVEEGTGEVILDGVRTQIHPGFAVLVPAGARHNIINSGTHALKLYTLYSPPSHRDGAVHDTRAQADADPERFDGETTEQAGDSPPASPALPVAP
jgi:mannose-6-phosphate isomerase-like protein (cupin superfamily)